MRIWIGILAVIMSFTTLYYVFFPDILYSESPQGTRLSWTARDVAGAISLFAYSLSLWLVTFQAVLRALRAVVFAVLAGGFVYWLYLLVVVAARDGLEWGLILGGAMAPIFGIPAFLALVLVGRYQMTSRQSANKQLR